MSDPVTDSNPRGRSIMSSDISTLTAAPAAIVPETPRPRRFWQWLLMVPAALAPLYTAAPVWVDKALAAYNNFHNGSYIESQEQIRLAQLNMDCLQAPYRYYTNPSQLKIDGTICPSGDVLVRAVDGLQRQAMYFVPTSTIRSQLEAATPMSNAAPAPASAEWPDAARNLAGVIRAAYSGTGGWEPQARLYLAQGGEVRVLWTRQVPDNPRYIIQHVMRPDGCFDQVIDLANGAVVQITRTPC
jgi:hypothetical protein